MAKKTYTLTPVTAVHIGTGNELTLLDYKIVSKVGDVDFKKKMYIKFSSDRILQRLFDNEKAMNAFERASVKGNMKELQEFFHENCTTIKDTDYPCEVTKGFLKAYNENLDKDPYLNAAIILQMYHTEGTPRPVIPGSSVKGSIRTALLNGYIEGLSDSDYNYWLKEFGKERSPENFDAKLQKKLFDYNDAKNDPLRAVSVPDCSFKATGTQLVGKLSLVSFNDQYESLDSIGAQIQAEVLRGELLEGKAVSQICINIDEKLQKTELPPQRKDERPKLIKKITFDDIHKSCNDFYWSEFQDEYKTFYKNVNDGTEKLIIELKNKLEKAVNTKGQFIVRVGRWSQVEFVTYEESFRKPITKKDKFGKPLGYGKTRTLFDYDGNYVPMGWCILEEKEEPKCTP